LSYDSPPGFQLLMFRHALRVPRQSPGFSALVVLVLAIGIGATTTIFSVVDGVLLRPLPYGDSSRLITIVNVFEGNEYENSAYLNIVDWRSQAKSIDGIAGVTMPTLAMTGAGEAVTLHVALTTADLFRMLDAAPMLGRTLRPADDAEGAQPVAVISERAWLARFGRRPSIVGETVTLDGRPATIVGVMPASFEFPIAAEPPDVWAPIDVSQFARGMRNQRGAAFLQVIGRLAPNATLQEANAELETIGRRLEAANPETNRGTFPRAYFLQHRLVREYRLALMMLLAAVGIVLVVACGNVANLLLSRGAARQRELAIRAAVGASRARLLRQLLAESLVLSTAAAVVGVLLAVWGVAAIAAAADILDIPRLREVSIDWRVLLFTTVLSAATGLLFGLAPALQLSHANAGDALRQVAHGMKGRRAERTRQALVVLEVALSLMLLASGGLLVRSLAALQRVDPGFVADRAITAEFVLPESRYADAAARVRVYERLRRDLASIPGATAVGLSTILPMSGSQATSDFSIEGPLDAPGEGQWAHYFAVSPDYFRAMGIRLIDGRTFTARDTVDASEVVIVSETMARRYWPGKRPIGQRLTLGFGGGPREIVGVVADVKTRGLWDEREASMYAPFPQMPWPFMSVVIRGTGDPMRLAGSLRTEVRRVDPDQPVDIKTMTEYVSNTIAAPRAATTVFAGFATFAVLLAGCGLFSVMAYSVAQRRREIGIRMALGAQSADVRSLVVAQAVKLGAVGLVFGLAGALAAGRVLEGKLLFGGVTGRDPVTLAGVCLTLFSVLVLAAYLPARRATGVSPAVVLRAE
jgi:putative ABC transport system permease protein